MLNRYLTHHRCRHRWWRPRCAAAAVSLEAQGVKISDPTSVVMIVNRDSNDIAFMDIKTKQDGGQACSSGTTSTRTW